MKKIFIISLAILSLQFAYAGNCLDLPKNLSRGEGSPSVLSLQNFLYEKGLLKATPNGYFGPSTFSSVKTYQKNIGLAQVGNLGPATRLAIKKETCASNVVTVSPVNNQTTINTPNVITVIATSSSIATTTIFQKPSISRLSDVTFFAGGNRDWDVYLYGTNLSTSTVNSVYFKSRNNSRKYYIGDVTSLNGTDIILPKDFLAKEANCGTGCSEFIPVGGYDITVTTNGLESNPVYTIVNGFISSVVSGTENQAVPSRSTNSRFGRLFFAAGVPTQLISVTQNVTSAGFLVSNIKSTRVIDDSTGTDFSPSTNTISAYQSQSFSLLGDLEGYSSGLVKTNFKITVMDYVSHQNTYFTSPDLLTTVTAYW